VDERLSPPAPTRRLAWGVGTWALLGMLLGGVGPGVAALVLDEGWVFAGFVIASELFGLLSGALLGLLDLPSRLPEPALLRAGLSGVLGLPLGLLWAGAAGAVGALGFVGTQLIFSGAPPAGLGETLFTFGLIGAALGAVVGTPGVVTFCAVRGWTLSAGLPWWLAHAAAVLVTGLLAIPGFGFVLGAPL